MAAEFSLDKAQVEELIGEPVAAFKLSRGCAEGDGIASTIKSILVTTLSGSSLPLVYKTVNLDDPSQAEFGEKNELFRIENLFYQTLGPWLEGLAVARGLPPNPLSLPKFYSAHTGDGKDYLCLQDVRPQGFLMKDKYAGLSAAEAELALVRLAQFHALTYFLIKWEGERIFEGQLKEMTERDKKMRGMIAEGTPMFSAVFENSIQLMEKRNPDLGARMRALGNTSDPKQLFETGFLTDKDYFPVIIHGDIWMNNILFKYDAAGSPIDLKFIDLQMARRGNIFEDLQYFIFTSTTPEVRKGNLATLLSAYYDGFQSTLDRLQCSPPPNFSRGFFVDSFRKCYVPTFRYLAFAIPLQLGTPMSELKKLMGPPAAQDGPNQDGGGKPEPPSEAAPNGESEAGGMMDHLKIMAMVCRLALETSPRALERLESVTQELADLKIL